MIQNLKSLGMTSSLFENIYNKKENYNLNKEKFHNKCNKRQILFVSIIAMTYIFTYNYLI